MSVKSFFRRELPCPPAIAFSSDVGQKFFGEALEAGTMRCFFPLAEHFRTQDEPAFCGLGTLVTVLNALKIDPHRQWKGVWRYWHEEMLDCCEPLENIKMNGILFSKLACLARCNGANVKAFRSSNSTEQEFREQVVESARSATSFLIVSYSRKEFMQTGDGHFSPIGGYNQSSDSVLILDVARFKYPPHWLTVSSLWRSMQRIDKDTGHPRGFLVLSAATQSNENSVTTLFSVSPTRVNWSELRHLLISATLDDGSGSIRASDETSARAFIQQICNVLVGGLGTVLVPRVICCGDDLAETIHETERASFQALRLQLESTWIYAALKNSFQSFDDATEQNYCCGDKGHSLTRTHLDALALLALPLDAWTVNLPPTLTEIIKAGCTIVELGPPINVETQRLRTQLKEMLLFDKE